MNEWMNRWIDETNEVRDCLNQTYSIPLVDVKYYDQRTEDKDATTNKEKRRRGRQTEKKIKDKKRRK